MSPEPAATIRMNETNPETLTLWGSPIGGDDPAEFAAWAEKFCEVEDPDALIEEALRAFVVVAMRRLQRLIAADATSPLGDPARIRETAAAQKLYERALADLRRHRSAVAAETARVEARAAHADHAAARAEAAQAREADRVRRAKGLPHPSNSFTVPSPPPATDPIPDLPEGKVWTDYVGIDPKVSREWPVVLGTWLFADRVVTARRKGLTMPEILAKYKELNPDQVVACHQAGAADRHRSWEGEPGDYPHKKRVDPAPKLSGTG